MPPSMDKSKEAAPMTSPIKPQGPLDEHQHKNTISIKQDPPDVAIFQQKINQLAIELILAREDDVSLENIQLKHQQLERLAQQHARVAMAKRHGTEFILVTASKIMKDFCNSSPEILSAYPQEKWAELRQDFTDTVESMLRQDPIVRFANNEEGLKGEIK